MWFFRSFLARHYSGRPYKQLKEKPERPKVPRHASLRLQCKALKGRSQIHRTLLNQQHKKA